MRDARPELHTLSRRIPGTPSPSRATDPPFGASCPPHFLSPAKKAHGFPFVFAGASAEIFVLASRMSSLVHPRSFRVNQIISLPDTVLFGRPSAQFAPTLD